VEAIKDAGASGFRIGSEFNHRWQIGPPQYRVPITGTRAMSNDVEKTIYKERESGMRRRWLSFQESIAQIGCAMSWLLQGVYNHCRIWRTATAGRARRPKLGAAERGT
jgi:hypothetical protein